MMYLYLTPQLHDICPLTGTKIMNGIIETNRVDKEDCATYNAIILAMNCNRGVVFCNGDISDLDDYNLSLDDIIEQEAIKYKSIKEKDPNSIATDPITKQIMTSALSFYQGLYMDDNKDEIEEAVIKAIKESREKDAKKVRTELDLITKMYETYKLGNIVKAVNTKGDIVSDDAGLAAFVKELSKVVRDGEINPNEISISDYGFYTIDFLSNKRIIRESIDGKENYSIEDI